MNYRLFTWLVVLIAMIVAVPLLAADEAKPERIGLWNGKAPVGGDKFEESDAFITVHRPAKANGTAIVICPGGGYGGLMMEPEGHGIARL
jgi:hypothetical protein